MFTNISGICGEFVVYNTCYLIGRNERPMQVFVENNRSAVVVGHGRCEKAQEAQKAGYSLVHIVPVHRALLRAGGRER